MSPTLAHLHENEPHPLQDGLLISTPEDIRAQVATWTVLVIIESPTPPQGISEKLTNFRHVLELLYHHRPPSNTTRMIWDQHITDMEDALTSSHSAPRVRRRRGLLNIVGEISSKLFGTATQSEVEECERHVNSAMKLESQSCAVTVTRVDAPIGTVKEVTPTIFVLLSFGETYSVHCPKKPERANYLPLGIYTLRVAATCQVRGKEWLLSGTVRYNSTLKYVNPFLSVDTLNLPQLLPDELVRQQLERPEWKHLPAITDLTIQKLKLPPKVSHPGWNTGPDHPYHSGWITAGVSITFSVGVTIFILRKWGNTRWCKKTDTIPKSRDAETASELQSLGPTWVALTQPASPSPGGTAESSN